MTYEELCSAVGEAELKCTAYKHAFLTQNNEAVEHMIAKAKAEERAEIMSALHTALYITSTTAPTYAGLIQAVDIIKARG